MSAAFAQAWPPFALIAGLLLIGGLANRDGLFAWGGAWLRRLPGGTVTLLAAALALVAVVTAVLNLDTAVVFLTPVLVVAARRRRVAVEPFLYGCLFMANASSLFLPGSNLTNLLVLDAHGSGAGAAFAARMFPLAITASLVTALGVGVSYRRRLAAGPIAAPGAAAEPADGAGREPAVVLGVGALAAAAAVVLVLALRQPALAVFAVGALTTAVELVRRRIDLVGVRRVLGPASLAAAFALTVALGTLARDWSGPAELLAGASGPRTAALAAVSTVFVNNLPAAALYSAHAVDHPRMLLLGLNLGPNLAATGALSALLWFRAAREVDARPSPAELSRRGVPLAVLAIAAAILVGTLT